MNISQRIVKMSAVQALMHYCQKVGGLNVKVLPETLASEIGPEISISGLRAFWEQALFDFTMHMGPERDFQERVDPWLIECFGQEVARDKFVRNYRFFEEAGELVQAAGMTREEAHQLVDYVYARPVGNLPQEIGGVMTTLAALCLAHGEDMHEQADIELQRIMTPEMIAKIRFKSANKPHQSPLPGTYPGG